MRLYRCNYCQTVAANDGYLITLNGCLYEPGLGVILYDIAHEDAHFCDSRCFWKWVEEKLKEIENEN